MADHDALSRRLGYRFSDPDLLDQALSHRSRGARNYERLEFLGDGLLNFVIAAELYHLKPDLPEGDLSRLRASLVRESTLAEVGRQLQLGDHLALGVGELKSGGFDRGSILADGVEALLGAVFLDGGYPLARELVCRLFAERLADLPRVEDLKDPKTRLQELLQGRGLPPPGYAVIAKSGQAHNPEFTVSCTLPSSAEPVTAQASSRRKAEQAAASVALTRIDELLAVSK